MLTFLHISDLHLTTTDAGSQFDVDLPIREALLDDLGIESRTRFDAILITGDVAYHGEAKEYERAKAWLERVRTKTSSDPDSLFVVPGNHDVNRSTLSEQSSLYALHQLLRAPGVTKQARNDSLAGKLKDPFNFLAGLSEYCAFSQEYDCPTTTTKLAWTRVLSGGKTLEDGTGIRFHGLNSALISDGADDKANLFLGKYQFDHFKHDPSHVNVILCHHPHNWLIDDNDANDFFRSYGHLLLTGHEHDTRCYNEGGCVRLRAGAIHPNPREEKWEPCYHVIRLSIETTPARSLKIQVETRCWLDKAKRFGPAASSFHEERIALGPWTAPPEIQQKSGSANLPIHVPLVPEMSPDAQSADSFAAARRKLIVHFFRIGSLARIAAATKAGVWMEAYDALEGQKRWACVFDAAETNGKLGALWDAVAESDAALSGQSNPFTTHD